MWAFAKKLLAKSNTMNALLRDVVFKPPPVGGSVSHSFLEWRVKRSIDQRDVYIGLSMKPDGYAGAEGSPTNYMNFSLEAATRLRDNLNECIAVARHQMGDDTSPDTKRMA